MGTAVGAAVGAAGGAGAEHCLVRSVSRPAFFEETLKESDEMLLAHQVTAS